MSDNRDRLLSDADVEAIVTELKTQLVHDFQLEVGKGLFDWAKKALWWVVLIAAIYGIAGDRQFLQQIAGISRGH